jgi:hypothetical protein
MEIKRLAEIKKEVDSHHGWTLESTSAKEKLEVTNKDLIGLFGETGELADLNKKLDLEMKGAEEMLSTRLLDAHDALSEELIDNFIYAIRIVGSLDTDIEECCLQELSINMERFKKHEQH